MSDANDNRIFDTAYNAFYRPIYTFSFSMLGNADEAEDISQETFMKLYNHLAQHPPLENTKNWLFRVASNICINHLKRQNIFRKILSQTLEPDNHLNRPNLHNPSRQNPVEHDFIREQEQQMVRNALEKLPKREQALLVLYRDRFSYADMAEILNMKKSSVGKILSRARETLAREIRKGEKK